MKRKYLQLFAAILIILLLSNSTCNNTCSLNQVTLSDFWKEAGNQNISIDPLGGYIFLYWIDNNGNVCHGEPGVNGQPGPLVINAFSQEAWDAANSNSFISEERMKQLQQFIYANEKYHSRGTHFAQFDNVIWRSRSDGKVFMDRGFHTFSKPVIVNPENTVCLMPVYAAGDEACGKFNGFLLPNLFPGGQQHPTIGLVKAQPSDNLSETELLNYCVLKLPHGREIAQQ